ncbi:MAG: hypothetical protein V4539_03505 [Bacteroidota bacterium]
MDKRYVTLQTLANIVRDTQHPTQYLCTPREMILHSVFDWDLIHTHLSLLANEEFIRMVQADTLQFFITEKGLEKVNAATESVDDKMVLSIRKETINS